MYFDGRKDNILQQISGHRKLTSEVHVALIEEPGSKYIGHISLTAAESTTEISQGIITFTKKYMSLQNLSVIGCDGTNVNTGWKGEIIRLLETYIGRPLQWNIYMLYTTNDLALRHLILEMDGCTRGPYSYSGPIGFLLKD